MRTMLAICALAAAFAVPFQAHAYYPHAGDRAADIYGRDIVNGGVVHLEDYAGQWIWVEFWSPG